MPSSALKIQPPQDPHFFLLCGPNRVEYIARFSDAEWFLWIGIGGVTPTRVREKFKAEIEKEKRAK